ncbi:MAG: hypothetical protein JWQ90_1761 [Hydrocarboniphaga sp.]|uniref:hypothetical protein n=1 Tax=Hydrocarboniphaga sp. TaxID=2033016 RepID=UPI00261A91EA|nr:hypothetical protein [Hydrocarboniphaga sp.]MDB5969311.1 hypothetical protein [Hydrocarboniphaga sp.]
MNRAFGHDGDELGPWNPGIRSSIPRRLLPLSTIFRPENVFTSVEQAAELCDLTGLEFSELVVFRPRRLVLHEILIRVTGELSVPDGSRYEDLGINFRRMVGVILARYVEPSMDGIVAAYDEIRQQLRDVIQSQITAASLPPIDEAATPADRRVLGFRWPRSRSRSGGSRDIDPVPGFSLPRAADEWEAQALTGGSELEKTALLALARVARALYNRNGHSWAFTDLLASIALDLACNRLCSERIGELVEPCLRAAVAAEGYRFLPSQPCPVVMNTKGPSASGKSTLRPLQRVFLGSIGVRWDEFALISPDIWRKQLLDYASVGADYRYAAMLTGEEIAIIDQKLDHHMARRAEQGRIPHLLIDRFRFGSFAAESENTVNSMLSRFGGRIYFCFMITPPQDIVERAWTRGLQYGRYKAVDDLLAHSVEAYSGMPRLFLAWAQRAGKQVHYEFLDNSVAFGQRPRTVAFGSNGTMVVLDVKGLLDVGRFRSVNINATAPQQLYLGSDAGCPDFLVQCVRRLPEVVFADQASGRIYLHLVGGRAAWADPGELRKALSNREIAAGLRAAVPGLDAAFYPIPELPRYVSELPGQGMAGTLGDWGGQLV